MDSEVIRCFIAVELSEQLRREIETWVTQIQKQLPQFRFIPPKNWHLTLHFFGSISKRSIEDVSQLLSKALEQAKPFSFEVKGAGFFPTNGRPRIFWIGIVEGQDPLETLKNTVDSVLGRMGFNIEERKFHAHITLARSKGAENTDASRLNYEVYPRAVSLVDHITLFRSDLSSSGAKYTPIIRLPLKSLPAS